MKSSLKEKEKINKKSIVVAPVWIGSRYLDSKDFDAFSRQMCIREFEYTGIIHASNVDFNIDDNVDCQSQLIPILNVISALKRDFENKLIVMLVITSTFAESPHYDQFVKDVGKVAGNSRVYWIIMGPGLGRYYDRESSKPYTPNERKAHDLGAVYLYYNDDAPTAGALRLIAFMNRILGFDLPGDEIPNYSFEDLKKMAWHISRESFNAFEPKKNAIPKYEIKNGRPVFQI